MADKILKTRISLKYDTLENDILKNLQDKHRWRGVTAPPSTVFLNDTKLMEVVLYVSLFTRYIL